MRNALNKPEKQVSLGATFSRSHLSTVSAQNRRLPAASRWSRQRANDWYEKKGGIIGCNYIQSTADNQLEMWREGNFDPCVIDQELSWLADSGFNTIRVFLHPLAWNQDPKSYLRRIDWFLSIAAVYGISTILILFDAAWYPVPKTEIQPDPALQTPTAGGAPDPACQIPKDSWPDEGLNSYVQGVVNFFKDDPRVLLWDLLDLNEPGNMNLTSFDSNSPLRHNPELALRFLKKTIDWIRLIDPLQPITMAPFPMADLGTYPILDNYMFHHSDIISCYASGNKKKKEKRMHFLKTFGRPIICTEQMADGF